MPSTSQHSRLDNAAPHLTPNDVRTIIEQLSSSDSDSQDGDDYEAGAVIGSTHPTPFPSLRHFNILSKTFANDMCRINVPTTSFKDAAIVGPSSFYGNNDGDNSLREFDKDFNFDGSQTNINQYIERVFDKACIHFDSMRCSATADAQRQQLQFSAKRKSEDEDDFDQLLPLARGGGGSATTPLPSKGKNSSYATAGQQDRARSTTLPNSRRTTSTTRSAQFGSQQQRDQSTMRLASQRTAAAGGGDAGLERQTGVASARSIASSPCIVVPQSLVYDKTRLLDVNALCDEVRMSFYSSQHAIQLYATERARLTWSNTQQLNPTSRLSLFIFPLLLAALNQLVKDLQLLNAVLDKRQRGDFSPFRRLINWLLRNNPLHPERLQMSDDVFEQTVLAPYDNSKHCTASGAPRHFSMSPEQAAVIIQAGWRGYCTRCNRPEIKEYRRRALAVREAGQPPDQLMRKFWSHKLGNTDHTPGDAMDDSSNKRVLSSDSARDGKSQFNLSMMRARRRQRRTQPLRKLEIPDFVCRRIIEAEEASKAVYKRASRIVEQTRLCDTLKRNALSVRATAAENTVTRKRQKRRAAVAEDGPNEAAKRFFRRRWKRAQLKWVSEQKPH